MDVSEIYFSSIYAQDQSASYSSMLLLGFCYHLKTKPIELGLQEVGASVYKN